MKDLREYLTFSLSLTAMISPSTLIHKLPERSKSKCEKSLMLPGENNEHF